VICHDRKIIFIHSPKCGGESIEQAVFGRSDAFYNGDPYEGSPEKHWGCKQYIEHYGHKIFNDYFVFSFVRNPWDRAVSRIMYRNKRYGRPMDISFQLLKQECCINEACYEDLMLDQKCMANFIGRFENLQQDFDTICDKIRISQQKLPHKNKTEHKHYTEYYDDETRQIVAERYAKDIEYFGYKFGD
jgi:hypothetical protein